MRTTGRPVDDPKILCLKESLCIPAVLWEAS